MKDEGSHTRTIVRSTGSTLDWILKKIEHLVYASEKITKLNNIHVDGHAWSVVKLLLIGSWSYVYTSIISKYFREYWFVDLLAGSGTIRVKETGDIIVGSPFVAHFFAKKPYSCYIFNELDYNRYVALKRRAQHILGNSVLVVNNDCNKYAALVSKNARRKNAHFLVFLDNEGLDARWRTVEPLLGANCDIIINFPTSSMSRVLKQSPQTLDEFFGDNSWRRADTRECLLKIYLSKLEKTFRTLRSKEPYVSHIRVGSRRFYYDIILICKRGPYVQAWEYLKHRLNWKDPRIVKYSLDFLMGRAKRLDWFLDLSRETERVVHQMSNQIKKLDEFL